MIRLCAGFLIVLGIASLFFHLESGALIVIVGAFLIVLDDRQRKRQSRNG
jgi:hypothetical protein